ncbi:MAG: hypothetical protein MUE94_10010 [Verrucomicrobia bacterium]|jgi:hypothetical protein|nr:hypothetical protein [Verrucomicrobiota bacterium]
METDDPINGLPREAAWRGPLTPEQARQLESRWAAHPDECRAWEEEVALTRLLARLPDAAAPSNLTARVLSAIDARTPEPEVGVSGLALGWLRTRGWLPRLAGVAVLVVAGYVGHHQYQTHSQEAALVRSVVEVSELATAVPSVEVLQDFTAIRNLGSAAVPDEELLALLQ